MSTFEKCPSTALGNALLPFLRSPQDAARIRRDLHTYLEKQLNCKDGLSVCDLTNPTIDEPLGEPPIGLSGVRKAYWNALKAHRQAQAKYNAVKNEIAQLTRPDMTTVTAAAEDAKLIQEDMLPLLRQRERHRKLNVIKKTLLRITEDDSIHSPLDDFIKSRAGEMPLLPEVSSTAHGYVEEADAQILELKKAILTAKHVIDMHQGVNHTNGIGPHDPQAELYALQETRNMLIDWIEKQLTTIGESQAANEKPVGNLTVEGDDAPIPVSLDEIGQIYDQYLGSRKKLLQVLQHPPKHDFSSLEPVRTISAAKGSDRTGASAAAVLPFITPLLDLQNQEDRNNQHSVALQTTIASAEADTRKLITRLADESQFVTPGASRGEAWSAASVLADEKTKAVVKAGTEQGCQAAASARSTYDAINALPAIFEDITIQ